MLFSLRNGVLGSPPRNRTMKNHADQQIFQQNDEIWEYLRNSRLFSHLSDELLQQLVPLSELRAYQKDAVILREGQINERVFFLIRGEITVYSSGEPIFTLRRKGDIFGEMSVISHKPCGVTIVADTNVSVFCVQARNVGDYTDFESQDLQNMLYRMFAMILTEKLSLTTFKAKQYESTNRQLAELQEVLQAANEILEQRVAERTAELQETNATLMLEVKERELTQAALKESRELFRRFMDNSPVFAFMKDDEGGYLYLNLPLENELRNLSPKLQIKKSLAGIKDAEIWPEAVSTNIRNNDKLTMAKRSTIEVVESVPFPDGIHHWLTYKFPITDAFGRNLIAGLAMDVTEQKRMESELVEAKERAEEMNRLKSSFLANMSHELRTPMNGIIGFSSILCESLEDSKLQSFANRILKSSERLLSTLNDILDLSKLESSQQELQLVDLNVVNECQSLISFLEPIAARKKIDLRMKTSETSAYARLDEKVFGQIFNNLLGNALKFTDSGSVSIEIGFEHKRTTSWIVVRVTDTGIGINPEFLPFVFDEFTQESNGLGRQYEGTGLGLTITKKLVELMKGEIYATSEKGQGSTFILKFPAVVPSYAMSSLSLGSSEESLLTQVPLEEQPRLLVVEDDSDSQEVARFFLSPAYQVECVDTGETGLEEAKKTLYDLVLIDINLGYGMNGVELARKLRGLPEYEKTPLIAITAYAMKGDRERLLDAGFNEYIAKPYKRKDILALMLQYQKDSVRKEQDLAEDPSPTQVDTDN